MATKGNLNYKSDKIFFQNGVNNKMTKNYLQNLKNHIENVTQSNKHNFYKIYKNEIKYDIVKQTIKWTKEI